MVWYWLLLGALALGSILVHRAGLLRFDRELPLGAWLAACLIAFTGSWMLFDGARALMVGDYVTPGGSGDLGPWAGIVEALGVDPRSVVMKTAFVVQGSVSLAVPLAFLTAKGRSWRGMAAVSVLALWYLPFGTFFGAVALVLLLNPAGREAPTGPEER